MRPSNIDICSTFSTWKRRRRVSELITEATRLSIAGDLVTVGSWSICEASDIDDMGVLNSCVILLMKSFFISVSFFCLKAVMMVKTNTTSRIRVKANEGIMNGRVEKIKSLRVGKNTLR